MNSLNPLSEQFIDKKVKILKINFNNNVEKKLKNNGLYVNQIIEVKKIGNYKNMLGIKVNNILFSIRLKDAKNIFVIEVKE